MKKFWIYTLLFIFAMCAFWFTYKDTWEARKGEYFIRFSDIANKIALPYRIAKLSALPPDQALYVPVSGVETKDITDTWGAARNAGRTHEGTDIFAKRNTAVYSATHGYVTRIGQNTLGGNIVVIIGAGRRGYYYAHLERFAEGLKVGQEVTPDTVIGFVGNTGNASGTPPHLHFSMYTINGAENPYELLKDRK
jgi:murein DD-endopeptidase MepM/ murein hydrolase activator NlpD